DRLKRDLGLELGRKPSACLHAGSSFSSVDPPYAPVSETGTTSDFQMWRETDRCQEYLDRLREWEDTTGREVVPFLYG
ncbi:hypothetical protein, partial [Paracoccus sp. SSJ]|uniref:hypothetical protein n=1 Tax=Paracoccus sp. SSJ TaxID=3050636 RepID=UPI00254B7D67